MQKVNQDGNPAWRKVNCHWHMTHWTYTTVHLQYTSNDKEDNKDLDKFLNMEKITNSTFKFCIQNFEDEGEMENIYVTEFKDIEEAC